MSKSTRDSIGFGVLIALAIIVMTVVIGSLFGYRVNVIEGESMTPTFKPGELVVTKPASNLATGDVIVFDYNGIPTLHRITAVEEGGYRTKGDAEGLFEEAQIVPVDAVNGESWLRIPALGPVWPFLLGLSPLGWLAFAVGFLVLTLPDWPKVIRENLGSNEPSQQHMTRNRQSLNDGRNALPPRRRP